MCAAWVRVNNTYTGNTTMSTHTPGPWKPRKSGVYEARNGGICVAMRHPQATSEWPHNAPLIAAAPDLLAALTYMTDTLSAHIAGSQTFIDVADMLDQARAAISKAEGR